MKDKSRIIIFASGGGSNFINIYKHIVSGEINAKIVLLISNNPNSGAVQFAEKNNINFEVVNKFRFKNELNINKRYEMILDFNKPDLILLAGFMKKIPNNIVSIYNGKIINIHPSLLPKFGGKGYYGENVHKAVLDSKEEYTGVTIHFVNNEYDKGDIILQKKVKVEDGDTVSLLSKRVLKLEHSMYPEVVKKICQSSLYVK